MPSAFRLRWLRGFTSPSQPSARAAAWPSLRLCLAVALAYLCLDWYSFVYPMRGTSITAWNPQSALAVALLLNRPQAWWVLALVVPVAALLWGGVTDVAALLLSSAAVLCGYGGTAALLRRVMGDNPALSTRRQLLQFAAVVCSGALLLSLLYASALWLTGTLPLTDLALAVQRRWVGEAVSFLITLPLLFWLLDSARRAALRQLWASAESWVLMATAMALAYGVLRTPPEDQLRWFYLLMLPAAWAAARFGQTGAVWICATLQALLIMAVQTGAYRPTIVFDLHTMLSVMGAMVLLLGATVDEQRQTDERQRAAEQNAASAELAAALAHELHQPLTAMRNYARALELMAAKGALPTSGVAGASTAVPDAGEVTRKLVNEVQRASLVVQRLRDFFRRGAMELRPVQLDDLTRGVMRAQSEYAAGHDVTLDLLVADRLPPVMADTPQLEVVLRNLVVNAIEASAQAAVADRRVRVEISRQPHAVHWVVWDVGPGLSPEQALAIFAPGHSSKTHGMGLGLALSRTLVRHHGGELWAQPGPRGQLCLSLPVTADEDRAE